MYFKTFNTYLIVLFIFLIITSCGLPDPIPLLKEPSTETSSDGITVFVELDNDFSLYGLNFYYHLYNADDDFTAEAIHLQKIDAVLNSTATVDIAASNAAYSLGKNSGTETTPFTIDLKALIPLLDVQRSLTLNFSPINFFSITNNFSTNQKFTLIRIDGTGFYKEVIVEQIETTVNQTDLPLDIRTRNLNVNRPIYVSIFIASSARTFDNGPRSLFSIPVRFGFFELPGNEL